jgi:hypothetical protein
MKQTAVEWLEEYINCSIQLTENEKKWFKQAKEMEKEQIIDAYDNNKMGRVNHGEQYYNETFKSE